MQTIAKSFRLELVKKIPIKSNVQLFYFSADLPGFTSGQYVQLILPHKNVDERGTSRFFTIASSPTEKNLILAIKKGDSSFKKKLFSLTIGAKINSFGPMGKFILDGEIED